GAFTRGDCRSVDVLIDAALRPRDDDDSVEQGVNLVDRTPDDASDFVLFNIV
uniref:PPM-type phosphatase domain-containing protein n=1 Tax=Steinernema glaseri TaxID=37863 RepID=A0A1I7ZLH0_9BILA